MWLELWVKFYERSIKDRWIQFMVFERQWRQTLPTGPQQLLCWLIISANKFVDNCVEDMLQHQYHKDSVVAEIRHTSKDPTLVHMADIPVIEKLEKFIEDVR